jgi:hypothetical protein
MLTGLHARAGEMATGAMVKDEKLSTCSNAHTRTWK